MMVTLEDHIQEVVVLDVLDPVRVTWYTLMSVEIKTWKIDFEATHDVETAKSVKHPNRHPYFPVTRETPESSSLRYHEMVVSHNSVFRSLYYIPIFHSFHVPSLRLSVCLCSLLHLCRFLVCLYPTIPPDIPRYLRCRYPTRYRCNMTWFTMTLVWWCITSVCDYESNTDVGTVKSVIHKRMSEPFCLVQINLVYCLCILCLQI